MKSALAASDLDVISPLLLMIRKRSQTKRYGNATKPLFVFPGAVGRGTSPTRNGNQTPFPKKPLCSHRTTPVRRRFNQTKSAGLARSTRTYFPKIGRAH